MRSVLGIQVALLALAVLAVIIQTTAKLMWFGVGPNFVLAVLIVAAITVVDLRWYLAILLVISMGMSMTPAVDPVGMAFVIVGLLLYWIRIRFLAGGLFSVTILTFIGTLGLYLILEPSWLADGVDVVALELLYTASMSGIGLWIIKTFGGETITGSTI